MIIYGVLLACRENKELLEFIKAQTLIRVCSNIRMFIERREQNKRANTIRSPFYAYIIERFSNKDFVGKIEALALKIAKIHALAYSSVRSRGRPSKQQRAAAALYKKRRELAQHLYRPFTRPYKAKIDTLLKHIDLILEEVHGE